jgi:hypothetical protein
MNYLSATPPPARIVFVNGAKVKEQQGHPTRESNDI